MASHPGVRRLLYLQFFAIQKFLLTGWKLLVYWIKLCHPILQSENAMICIFDKGVFVSCNAESRKSYGSTTVSRKKDFKVHASFEESPVNYKTSGLRKVLINANEVMWYEKRRDKVGNFILILYYEVGYMISGCGRKVWLFTALFPSDWTQSIALSRVRFGSLKRHSHRWSSIRPKTKLPFIRLSFKNRHFSFNSVICSSSSLKIAHPQASKSMSKYHLASLALLKKCS